MQLVLGFLSKLIYVIAFLLAVLLAYNTLTYLNFDPHFSFLRLKQAAIATGWYLPAYYSHVLLGGIILVFGFLQLHPSSNKKYRRVHRAMGYVYVMGILFFAAPGGMVMSMFVDRGPLVFASFLVQSILWFTFTAIAFNQIRKGNIEAHREWMWRSYALTFAAVTLRVYIFFSSYHFDLSHATAYATIAWLSWTLNLVVVELYLRSIRSTNQNS